MEGYYWDPKNEEWISLPDDPPDFWRLNWSTIALHIGGALRGTRETPSRTVEIYTQDYGNVEIYDNGGEVHVSLTYPNPNWFSGLKQVLLDLHGLGIKPTRWTIDYDIPYRYSQGEGEVSWVVGDLTMAYRIRAALRNEKIDWELRLD